MTKAAFFINPLSHNVKKQGSILSKIGPSSDITHYHLHSFSGLKKYVSALAKVNIEIICIEGGDGTIHGVLTEIIKQKDIFQTMPKFIILPGGMTNLVAAHLGIKKPTQNKITARLQTQKKTNTIHFPLLKIRYDQHIHYGFLFSTGAIPNGTRYCLEKVHTSGINGAAAVLTTLLKALLSRGTERKAILRPTALALKVNNENITGDHILSIGTTLPSLMIGLNPFWGPQPSPVKITHVHANAKRYIRNIMRLLRSTQSASAIKTLEMDGFQSWSTSTLEIAYRGEMVLDGEFLPHANGPVTLSATQPLTFIR